MDLFNFLNSIMVVLVKRLRHNLGLSISAVLGIVAVMGIIVCVPVFSHAVSSEVLRTQLSENAVNLHRGLFSLHLYYQDMHIGSGINLEQSQVITRYIRDNAPRLIGPRISYIDSEVQTGHVSWTPETFKVDKNSAETWLSMGFFSVNNLIERAVLIDGQWPKASLEQSGPVPVAVMEDTATAWVGQNLRQNQLR